MRIKTKLTFGVGLLFLMIFLLAAVSGRYIYLLKVDTNNILVANYNSVEYSRQMLLALEDIKQEPEKALLAFDAHLAQQLNNMTESGEKDATASVAKLFEAVKQKPADELLLSALRKDLSQLMRLNMDAIELKSDIAGATAEKAIVIISVTGTLCFLIAFVLLVNLPSTIANPISELTESIKEIADQNYKKRLHFKGNNEFGELAHSFNSMAEKLEEYSESKLDKILKSKKRIETLIDNMTDPVIGIDEARVIIFINEEALKVTGLKRHEVIGVQVQEVALYNDLLRDVVKDILHPKDKPVHEEPLKIFADDKESYFEKEVIDINIIPTGEDETEFIGQVIMLRNITPFKELDLAKTNFIGSVSHEFKTPIASIQMGVQLLQNQQIGVLNEEQDELIQGIKDDAVRLLGITGELIKISQVESGSIQMNMAATEVMPIIDYAMHANRVAAEHKQISFALQKEEGTDRVLGDGEKTAWVLTNLLSNAIRYSHENSTIAIAVRREANKLKFSVTDSGQGIEPRYLTKIFQRYFRVPGSRKEGTGLGLSISKEFVEAQGGTITVASEYGVGSTFTVVLNAVV